MTIETDKEIAAYLTRYVRSQSKMPALVVETSPPIFEKQVEALRAVVKYRTREDAARALGKSQNTIKKQLQCITETLNYLEIEYTDLQRWYIDIMIKHKSSGTLSLDDLVS